MQLNKKYKNPFGETFEISRFRFYAGKFAPIYSTAENQTNKKIIHPKPTSSNENPNYRLIDFSDSASTFFFLGAPEGICTGIRFQLGIDSADQNNGAQTGALDPVNGMFWTWNSGYVAFKLEGFSPESNQPAHLIAYHIGGYRSPDDTHWEIKLNGSDSTGFAVFNTIEIEIAVELDYFFDGMMPIHIKDISTCTTPGELAHKLSENFAAAFKPLRSTK